MIIRRLAALSFLMFCATTQAQDQASNLTANIVSLQSLQVVAALPAPAKDVTDLKFSEIFKMPVGPRGMEPSMKLSSLNKKPVRIVGYMAKQETPTPGLFIVTPLPVNMGDEDDKFSDDMPANSIFVHVDSPDALVQYTPGLINLTGVLSVGGMTEVDGRVSFVRVKLDAALSGLSRH